MSEEYRSNPIIRTYGGAAHFLKEHRNMHGHRPCYLGHVECSTHNGGPCLDETLSNFATADTWEPAK